MANDKGKVVIERPAPKKFSPLLEMIKLATKNIARNRERAIVNRHSGSSIVIRENGNINVVAGAAAQYKLSKGSGKSVEITTESQTLTNRKRIDADDIMINGHKLNPKLWEYTDMKEVYGDPEKVVGNFTVLGTVLVKAWEPNLQKYVLIRRLARFPLFSPKINAPDIHPNLDVENDLEGEFGQLSEAIDKATGNKIKE